MNLLLTMYSLLELSPHVREPAVTFYMNTELRIVLSYSTNLTTEMLSAAISLIDKVNENPKGSTSKYTYVTRALNYGDEERILKLYECTNISELPTRRLLKCKSNFYDDKGRKSHSYEELCFPQTLLEEIKKGTLSFWMHGTNTMTPANIGNEFSTTEALEIATRLIIGEIDTVVVTYKAETNTEWIKIFS